MSAETILYSLLSAIVGGLIVAVANHLMARRRELEKKTTDIRIDYLIDCWMKIERAAFVGPEVETAERSARYDALEESVAKIILLGNAAEVTAAKKFARELAHGSNASVMELLNSLRDSLRKRLELDPAGPLDLFFRMQRDKK
jgi:hypothetical protein